MPVPGRCVTQPPFATPTPTTILCVLGRRRPVQHQVLVQTAYIQQPCWGSYCSLPWTVPQEAHLQDVGVAPPRCIQQ
jgi:hypothetical protein